METFFSILEDEEYNQIWDRIDNELQFQPSIRVSQVPFRLPAPWVVHDLTYFPVGQRYEDFKETVVRALVDCLGEDDWIYALDWQHSGFRYDPRRPVTEHDHWVEDARYGGVLGGGYNAYFPEFYPDGDYYFFVQRDLKWGYLGHPWRREIWLFGAPLVKRLSPELEALGFPVKILSETE